VLIAGGGVAGLETMLAVRDLAGNLVDIELLSPEHHFWYRPLAVGEPFDVADVHRFELQSIAVAVGATFTPAAIAIVDPAQRRVLTSHGAELAYDVLVVACGTRFLSALDGALTFRGPSDVDRLRGLLGEIDVGAAKRIAFALPRRAGWSLPLYELALLTATHVEDRDVRGVELSVVTHEHAPLQGLGPAASDAVTRLLHERGIVLHTGRYPLSFREGELALVPDETVAADRVVALARLAGQPIPGIPQDRDGFVATDRTGRIEELDDVYAAGDITRFPIKQGGIAAQQGVHVAHAIAARAGADVAEHRLEPVLHALLLTGRDPLYLYAETAVGSGGATEVTAEPLFWPPAKISSRYLAPFLAAHERGQAFVR
jgi:sulfide:quinone oxidoreductase